MTQGSAAALQESLDRAFRLASDYERRCTGCAQSTIAAALETLGIQADDVFRAASGLADGIGLTGDGSCGALTGGVMVLGLVRGRKREHFGDPFAALASYQLARRLHQHFVSRYGSCRCHDIQERLMGRSFDLLDQPQIAEAVEHDVLGHCSTVVGESARKTVELILAGDEPEPASGRASDATADGSPEP
jgi:C_GCAxxG_C_C family probable redox protein